MMPDDRPPGFSPGGLVALLVSVLVGSCIWAGLIVVTLAVAAPAPPPVIVDGGVSLARLNALQQRACGAEDSDTWVWSRCGNRRRGVVTMWGTPKSVTCGDFRWLARHGDLDRRSTPVLRGDWQCGR